MNEIFERDPLLLTRADIDSVIEHYRKARAQFNLGDKAAGKTVKAVKGPKKASLALDLESLLGEIKS